MPALHADILLAGLLTGAVYAMMALGLSVIFGVLRVVNFAHGEMLVLGMFGAYAMHRSLGLEPIAAAPLVAGLLFLAGFALQRGLLSRIPRRPEHLQMLALIGLAMMLTSAALMVFGPDVRNVPLAASFESLDLPGGLVIDKTRALAAGGAVAGLVALWSFFRFTRTGVAIRACADNPLGAEVVGLDVGRLYALAFGIGTACVGGAGALLVMQVDVQPYLAGEYTLLAFVIVIVGGLGSFAGALLGGLLIGVAEAIAGFVAAPSLKSLFSFAVLILVVLLRPRGLLARRA